LRLVAKEVTQPKRKVRYVLTEPFLQFWFRFLWADGALLEASLNRAVWERVKGELGAHLGGVFERVALGYVVKLIGAGKLKINPDYVRRWVDRDTETDIVTATKQEELACTFEVKWGTFTLKETQSLLGKLESKALNIKTKEKVYGLVAKTLEHKEPLLDSGCQALTLEDILS
jgi:AAA+ ATPase superfamily predicted ATPase